MKVCTEVTDKEELDGEGVQSRKQVYSQINLISDVCGKNVEHSVMIGVEVVKCAVLSLYRRPEWSPPILV